ncbi:hypothetical protein HHI36_018099 [Cryptolaemus montrouzieri]|uniref:SURF1-like protein n=1 Tax=Cryptolaemus montrouzieri TaxID=559131 RepID=A0ABD2NZZ0_9CUCU
MNLSSCRCKILQTFRNVNKHSFVKKSSYQKIYYQDKNEIGPVGWMLLAAPVTAFALGTWQVKRKIWKENLIANMMNQTKSDPIPLIENLDNLNDLDYKPVYAKGTFLHDKELYMGPRSLLVSGDAETEGGLLSKSGSSTQGYLVITPFMLENSDKIILVNRGWVPNKKKNPDTRKGSQVEENVNIVGILRSQENRPTFLPKNNEKGNQWFYRDVEAMAKVTGSDPIFLDLTTDFDIPGGPIGGQTRVNLRNEHMSYIFTWYSLSAATGFMWYRKFIKNMPLK